MAVRKVVKNGIIKYVRVKESEEDNQSEIEKDHKDKDLIKRLTAIIELLESRIKQLETDKPKEESSDVMGYNEKPIADVKTYSCYA
jgi:hypothetical protein